MEVILIVREVVAPVDAACQSGNPSRMLSCGKENKPMDSEDRIFSKIAELADEQQPDEQQLRVSLSQEDQEKLPERLRSLEEKGYIKGQKSSAGNAPPIWLAISLTPEGNRHLEAVGGIPDFYNTPLPRKKKKLKEEHDELQHRLATSETGSRDYCLTEKRIERVRFEITRLDKGRLFSFSFRFTLNDIIGYGVIAFLLIKAIVTK